MLVAFFHEQDHLARARGLREALGEFERRMPERIADRILSRLPAEQRAPIGWSRFRRLRDFREQSFHGLGWERRAQETDELLEWVGFGWYHWKNHDYLLEPEDDPDDPSRWIGWYRSGIEEDSLEEARLFDRVRSQVRARSDAPADAELFDGQPRHGGGWPYFRGLPAASLTDVLSVDTPAFADAAGRLLPALREAVEEQSAEAEARS